MDYKAITSGYTVQTAYTNNCVGAYINDIAINLISIDSASKGAALTKSDQRKVAPIGFPYVCIMY